MLFSASLPSAQWFQEQLARQGWRRALHGELTSATRNVIAGAGQMKYRPARYDGEPELRYWWFGWDGCTELSA